MEGTIKKVVRDRGFGFINAQDGQEVFFHRSGFQGLDFDSVREGQHVQYEVERGEKGPRAVRIRATICRIERRGTDLWI
jgi:cold shock protein